LYLAFGTFNKPTIVWALFGVCGGQNDYYEFQSNGRLNCYKPTPSVPAKLIHWASTLKLTLQSFDFEDERTTQQGDNNEY